MTKIDLRTVKARQDAGLDQGIWNGISTVSEQALRRSRRAVGESLQLIVEFVAANEGVTRLEIADALCRKKSPRLINMIEHLVEVGILEKFSQSHDGITGIVWVYKVSE